MGKKKPGDADGAVPIEMTGDAFFAILHSFESDEEAGHCLEECCEMEKEEALDMARSIRAGNARVFGNDDGITIEYGD